MVKILIYIVSIILALAIIYFVISTLTSETNVSQPQTGGLFGGQSLPAARVGGDTPSRNNSNGFFNLFNRSSEPGGFFGLNVPTVGVNRNRTVSSSSRNNTEQVERVEGPAGSLSGDASVFSSSDTVEIEGTSSTPARSGQIEFDPTVGVNLLPAYGPAQAPAGKQKQFDPSLFTNREIRFFAEKYDVSPYRGYVYFLNRTSSLRETNPSEEYFVISVSPNGGGISLTNWSVFNYTRKIAHRFGKMIDVFVPFERTRYSNLVTRANDRIIVLSGESPVGASFRVNKCMGYKEQFKEFTPSLKTNCPEPETELINDTSVSFTDVACYDLVERISECNSLTNIPTGITYECTNFIRDTLTEEGCARLHQNDPNFLTSEIRLFLDSKRPLWKDERDAIFLLDDRGRLVDVWEY